MYATAKAEVLLSAGVTNTPHLLLNSGIGDEQDLIALNITPVHHLPDVGKNLTEHPAVANLWNTRNATVADPSAAFNAALVQWNTTRMGRLVMAVGNNVGWLRMNMSDPAVEALVHEYGDPAPGPKSPHIELLPTMVIPNMSCFISLLTNHFQERLRSGAEFCKCPIRARLRRDCSQVAYVPSHWCSVVSQR